jgi:hypothetical protein
MFDAAPDPFAFEAALRGVAAAMAEDHAASMRDARAEAAIATPAPARPARICVSSSRPDGRGPSTIAVSPEARQSYPEAARAPAVDLRQCPLKTSVLIGSSSAWIRKIIAWTSPTASTACRAIRRAVPTSSESSWSWKLL